MNGRKEFRLEIRACQQRVGGQSPLFFDRVLPTRTRCTLQAQRMKKIFPAPVRREIREELPAAGATAAPFAESPVAILVFCWSTNSSNRLAILPPISTENQAWACFATGG